MIRRIFLPCETCGALEDRPCLPTCKAPHRAYREVVAPRRRVQRTEVTSFAERSLPPEKDENAPTHE